MNLNAKLAKCKEMFKNNAVKIGATVAGATAVCLPSVAMAEGETTSAATTMATSFTTIASDVTSAIGTIAPIAIGVFSVFFIWKVGKRFFKSVANG